MTDDRSLERAARSWLEVGPTQAPPGVVEAALLRIETTSQERDLRIPWRLPKMFTPARAAAAAVVGVLLLGAAFFTLGRPNQTNVGVPGPSSSASPGPTTSAPSLDYASLPGWIVFEHFGQAPDGSTTTMDTDRRGIWLAHADGSGLHELAPGQPADGKYAPDISPDGKKVAFNSWNNKVQIWEAGIDGGASSLLTTDCNGVPDVCREEEPSYASDGSRIAFVRGGEGTTVIGIRDLATGAVTLLEPTRTKDADGVQTQPTWSPDGLEIAFARVQDDTKTGEHVGSRIFIVNADGTGLHQLPLDEGTPWGDPDWSPDGSRLVFSSWPIHDFNTAKVNVFSARPDGSDLLELTASSCGGCGAPSWTADGAHVLFWGPTTFWMMDAAGRDERPINPAKLTFFGDALGYGYYGYLQPTP
jgi:TolB protein